MGPKFASAARTKLCFSFGNVAQDEGSAMAQLAWNKGWKTADLAKDNTIIYFEAVVNAFKARFKQLGGKIKFETTYQDPTVHPAPTTSTPLPRRSSAPGEGHRHGDRRRVTALSARS